MKLMSFTSRLNDVHTELYPLNLVSKQLPVGFEWVKEGLVVSKSFVDSLKVGDLVVKRHSQFIKISLCAQPHNTFQLSSFY